MNIITKLLQKVPTSSMSNELILTIIIVATLMIVLSLGLKYLRRKTKNKILKKYIREFPGGLMIFGILALFLLWVRVKSIPILSMRLWWVFYHFAFVVWVLFKGRKLLALKKRLARHAK